MPIRLSGGIGLTPTTFTEVRMGDGTVLWSAQTEPASPPASTVAQFDATQESFSDGASVGTIIDRTGTYDLSGSATFQTGVINGNPVFRFDGSTDEVSNGSLSLSQPNAVVAVVKPQSPGADGEYVVDGQSSRQIFAVNSGSSSIAGGIWASSWVGGSTLGTDAVVLSGVYDGADSEFRVDGQVDASGNPGSNDLNGVYVGQFDGDIGELLFLSDPSDIVEAEQYLLEKWLGYSGGTSPNASYATISPSAAAPKSLSVVGDYAIAVGEGLSIIDISSPETPTEVGSVGTSVFTDGYGIDATANYAYVSDLDGQFRVFDISDKTAPTQVQTLPISKARKVTLDGDVAYVTTGSAVNEFHAVDVSDPPNASILDTVTDTDMDYCFESGIIGNHAIVCSRGTGLLVSIDVSDPSNMSKVATFSDSQLSVPYGIDFHGDTAFVTDSENADRVLALDASDPTNLSKISVFASANTIHVYGIDAYSSNGNDYVVVSEKDGDGVTTIDVTDPANMSQVGTVGVSGTGYDSERRGDYVFSVVRSSTDFVVSGTA